MPIKTNNLFFTYSSKHVKKKTYALNGINLDIPDNKITAIVGKTGSGKSTLIQTFNGLLKPSDGNVVVDEFVVENKKSKNLKELRKKVGVVFQFPEYQLFEETVLKDVMFGPKNFGFSEEESLTKAKAALSLLSIDKSYYERSPFELSGGERRKIALAGILAIEPEIIVFDEPTAGLDNKSCKDLISLFHILIKDGKTIIVVTHDMNFVYEHCDETILLENGNILYSGTPYDLFFNQKQNLVKEPNLVSAIKLVNNEIKLPNIKNIRTINDLVTEIKRSLKDE